MANKFRRSLEKVPEEISSLVDDLYDITEQILDIMARKGISQKELAGKLGKQESEISKWMKGTHNFTQSTINAISRALGEKVLLTDTEARAKYMTKEAELNERERVIKEKEKMLHQHEMQLVLRELNHRKKVSGESATGKIISVYMEMQPRLLS
jgi:transcriptional regulator with XRE-family HTH domain